MRSIQYPAQLFKCCAFGGGYFAPHARDLGLQAAAAYIVIANSFSHIYTCAQQREGLQLFLPLLHDVVFFDGGAQAQQIVAGRLIWRGGQQAVQLLQRIAGRVSGHGLLAGLVPVGQQFCRAVAAGCVDAADHGPEAQIAGVGRAIGQKKGCLFSAAG